MKEICIPEEILDASFENLKLIISYKNTVENQVTRFLHWS